MSRLVASILALSVLSALVACVAAPSAPPAPVPPASTAQTVYDALTAPIHARLYLCQGARAYNTGPVGYDGALVDYAPAVATPAGALLKNPTDSACLSSGYGFRGTASGGDSEHLGLDLANRHGGFVYAGGPGRVVSAGWKGTYGLMVEIDHGSGVLSRYGHLREINPRFVLGAQVPAGAALGRMGDTGNASGVHLHYEILIGGRHVNPLGPTG